MDKRRRGRPAAEIPGMEKYDFARLARRASHPRERMRFLAFAHIQDGRSFSEAARAIKVYPRTVIVWVKKFRLHGLEGLKEQGGRGSKPLVSRDQEQKVLALIAEEQRNRRGGRIRGQDVRELLEQHCGLSLSPSSVYKLLHRLGLSWITGRSQHPKANREQQNAFKKNFKEKVMEAVPKGVAAENVDVWFQDEARVGQQGTLTRTWAKKGTRPRLTKQQQFESAYLFGAVCPSRNEAVALVLPATNTDAMLLHLEELSAQVPPGRHAVVVLDRATWHTTKRVRIFPNLTLLPLPPASPELNPVEQVWQMLRDHWLANRCYDGYEDIVDACCKAWNWFVDLPRRIGKLCTRQWAIL